MDDEIDQYLEDLLTPKSDEASSEPTPKEKLEKLGFRVVEAIVDVIDLRMLGLPLIDEENLDDRVNLIMQYENAKETTHYRSVRARIVYGARIFEENDSPQQMWDQSLQTLTRVNSSGVRAFNTKENQLVADMIDTHLQSPEIPITIIYAHGDTDENYWMVDDITGVPHSLQTVLDYVEEMDREQTALSSSQHRSIVAVVSCNEGGAHRLSRRERSIMWYRTGKPGGLAEGDLLKVE